MRSAKVARWLDLVAFLLHHRYPVSREEIFRSVRGYESHDESARRKFERDKDELRAMGIEIATAPLGEPGDEEQVGLQLRPGGFYLPSLLLTDQPVSSGPYRGLRQVRLTRDEVEVLDRATRRLAARTEFPLAAAAASARRKLAFDLPFQAGAHERVIAQPLSEGSRQALAVLQEGVAAHRAVSCRYYSIARDVEEDRVIEPWGLFFQQSRWSCAALARDRQALRIFRVDRMRTATLRDGPSARFTVPASFDIRRYLGRAPWELGDGPETAVQVAFASPASAQVMAQRIGALVEGPREDGAAVLAFRVRDLDAFLRWLLTHRRQATVLTPASVARDLEALRRRVAALYAEEG